ncbi:MAG: hypothetical protein GTO13_01795 [Proteobacteria bacterium]|nr:hypothetical protein [Pseudomonadota bacterium]
MSPNVIEVSRMSAGYWVYHAIALLIMGMLSARRHKYRLLATAGLLSIAGLQSWIPLPSSRQRSLNYPDELCQISMGLSAVSYAALPLPAKTL